MNESLCTRTRTNAVGGIEQALVVVLLCWEKIRFLMHHQRAVRVDGPSCWSISAKYHWPPPTLMLRNWRLEWKCEIAEMYMTSLCKITNVFWIGSGTAVNTCILYLYVLHKTRLRWCCDAVILVQVLLSICNASVYEEIFYVRYCTYTYVLTYVLTLNIQFTIPTHKFLYHKLEIAANKKITNVMHYALLQV